MWWTRTRRAAEKAQVRRGWPAGSSPTVPASASCLPPFTARPELVPEVEEPGPAEPVYAEPARGFESPSAPGTLETKQETSHGERINKSATSKDPARRPLPKLSSGLPNLISSASRHRSSGAIRQVADGGPPSV